MKHILYKTVFFFLIGALWACSDDSEQTAVEPDKTEPMQQTVAIETFAPNGGEQIYKIPTKGKWSIATSDKEWVTTSRQEGVGEYLLSIKAEGNPTGTYRTATLAIMIDDEQICHLQLSQYGNVTLILPKAEERYVVRTTHFAWKPYEKADAKYILSYRTGEIDWVSTDSLTEAHFTVNVPLQASATYSWFVDTYMNGKLMATTVSSSFTTSQTFLKDKMVRTHLESKNEKAPAVILIGEGFINEDYAPGAAFDQAVERAIAGFFTPEPYASYKSYFNVYSVVVASRERGATEDWTGSRVNNAFGTAFTNPNSSAMSTDYSAIRLMASVVKKVTNLEEAVIILMVNHDRYGGITNFDAPGAVALCPISNREMQSIYHAKFENIVMHEAGGHGFGFLADEYTSGGSNFEGLCALWQNERSAGRAHNVEMTNDREQVLWKHFFAHPEYAAVGTYEGAFTMSKGFWRPESVSCMLNNMPYYNAPSREAIVKRIVSIVGETYSFDKFKEKDIQRTSRN